MSFLSAVRLDFPSWLPCGLFYIHLLCSNEKQALMGPQRLQEIQRRKHPGQSGPGALQRDTAGLQKPRAQSAVKQQWPTASSLPYPPQHFSSEGGQRGRDPGTDRKARNWGWNPPHPGALSGLIGRRQGVNSHENSDKGAPPPLPLPQLERGCPSAEMQKPLPSQA